jgi:hypothetical protein
MASATGCTGFSVGLNVFDTHRNRIPHASEMTRFYAVVSPQLSGRNRPIGISHEVTRDEPLPPINTAISRAEIVGVELL